MPMRNPDVLVKADEASEFIRSIKLSGDLHFDVETTGLAWHYGDIDIVSVGMANADGNIAIDTTTLSSEDWVYLLKLLTGCKLWAFNTVFDGGLLYSQAKRVGFDEDKVVDSLQGCTLTLFRALANEGYKGVPHSLEEAMDSLLLWKDHNKNWLGEMLAKYKLTKAEMSKLLPLEWDGFMLYNALDAEASFQLLALFKAQLTKMKLLNRLNFHTVEEIIQIRELIIQQAIGCRIDTEAMNKHITFLDNEMNLHKADFRQHPLVAPHIELIEKELASDLYKTHITIKKIWAKKQDEPWNNPSTWHAWKITGNGNKCTGWERERGYRYYRREPKITISNADKPAPEVNIQSNKQIADIIYGKVFKHVINDDSQTVDIHLPDRVVTIDLTSKGELPVNKTFFSVLGELGDILSNYSIKEKEKGYSVAIHEAASVDGRVHFQLRPHGTMTGRLSASGGINCQQQPKREGHLKCFIPDEGKILIQLDFSALEPVVQTEFSRDPTLHELYLSEKPHDIYLYWAQWIHPNLSLRAEIHEAYKKHYADGTLENMKKQYKQARSFIKVPTLAFSYGMGANKLMFDWNIKGYNTTYDEAKAVYTAYWNKLAVYKAWGDTLKTEAERKGWIVNGLGFPFAIPSFRIKDAPNTFVQSTGHGVLLKYNKHLIRRIKEAGIKSHTPVIQDLHDERISQIGEDDAERGLEIYSKAMDDVNNELNPDIAFTGTPTLARNLWEIKK